MIGTIIMGIALEVMGLMCWASICMIPLPARHSPRSPDWSEASGGWLLGAVITTGMVVTLVGSVVCWF
jgi:hypothetical protein